MKSQVFRRWQKIVRDDADVVSSAGCSRHGDQQLRRPCCRLLRAWRMKYAAC